MLRVRHEMHDLRHLVEERLTLARLLLAPRLRVGTKDLGQATPVPGETLTQGLVLVHHVGHLGHRRILENGGGSASPWRRSHAR